MDILFATVDLERLCLEERRAKKELGGPCAKKLRTRLADLAAARNVTDLVAGHPHPLQGDRRGQFALRLHGGYRLVFEPAQLPAPLHDGAIDWSQVTAVRIVFIGDYHD